MAAGKALAFVALQLLAIRDLRDATRARWSKADGTCSVRMGSGFRVHFSGPFSQGPEVCGRVTAHTDFEVEAEAVASVEEWLLGLKEKTVTDTAGLAAVTNKYFPRRAAEL